MKNEKLIIEGTEPIPSMTLCEAIFEYRFFELLEIVKNDDN